MTEERAHIQYLDRDEMLFLLNMYRSELPQRRENAQNYAAVYVSLLSVILGATLAATHLVTTFPQNLLITVGPILAFYISHCVKETVRRQDAHIREVIAMIAKAENCLGLHNKVEVKGVEHRAELWPKDESFVIDRWRNSRTESGESSEDFITKKGTGTFRDLCRVFSLMQITSILLLTGILLIPFIS